MLMQSWTNRPRDFWRMEGGKVIREHVVPRAQKFCIYDDRTTVMYLPDGRREEVTDKIFADPCESRRKTAEEWTGQTVFYRRPRSSTPDVEDEVDQIAEAFVNATVDVTDTFEEPPSDDEKDVEDVVHPAGYGVVDTGCGRGSLEKRHWLDMKALSKDMAFTLRSWR